MPKTPKPPTLDQQIEASSKLSLEDQIKLRDTLNIAIQVMEEHLQAQINLINKSKNGGQS